MELFLAFIAGLIVMDIAWAWKLGIPQTLYLMWKCRKSVNQTEE